MLTAKLASFVPLSRDYRSVNFCFLTEIFQQHPFCKLTFPWLPFQTDLPQGTAHPTAFLTPLNLKDFPQRLPQFRAQEGYTVRVMAEVLNVLGLRSWVDFSSWPAGHLF